MTSGPAAPLEDLPADAAPSLADLGLGFLKIGLLGFGGVAPMAWRVIVAERRWLGDEEYAGLLSACQILPGANTVNAAILIGDRFRGGSGAAVSVAALMTAPLIILALLAMIYGRIEAAPEVKGALSGSAAAASGLIIGTALKMITRLRLSVWAWLCGAAAFGLVAAARAPLPWVVLGVAPVSLAGVAWMRRRR